MAVEDNTKISAKFLLYKIKKRHRAESPAPYCPSDPPNCLLDHSHAALAVIFTLSCTIRLKKESAVS